MDSKRFIYNLIQHNETNDIFNEKYWRRYTTLYLPLPNLL